MYEKWLVNKLKSYSFLSSMSRSNYISLSYSHFLGGSLYKWKIKIRNNEPEANNMMAKKPRII